MVVALRLGHLCCAVVLALSISWCRGQGGGGGGAAGAGGAGAAGGAAGGAVVPGTQDAIQIVSQAALCFDNRQVINGCLQAMGINVNSNGGNSNGGSSNGSGGGSSGSGGSSNGSGGGGSSNSGSTATMCQGPCFGQMMLMMNCVNGILGNIQGYSPGLMQGVQAVFQMSCGNVGNSQQGGGASGGAAGGGAAAGGAGGTSGSSSGGGAAAAGGGANGGGASGAGSVTGSAGNAVGASGGNNMANGVTTAGGSGTTSPNGGSHVAVSDLDEPITSSANGPMGSRLPSMSMLRTWTCIWLLRLLWL
ncbi:uncharacterized protein LOC100276043 precursor [Zea mays]|uniref:Glycine-rich cell wall structural protein 1 n=1 Tax=Zea mays TaxID=4577 RepID=B6T3N7_MAIZE|nr:uncharacterized protein LOC100276043 precursor [Zea mays]ACG31720.1 hypothetical protein [Zea mays]|eukprot:NP_001143400.1 uncharacterized protein LOC100276043 precursor [Zea mays]